jgi:D-alanyl-D-alanine carboxypeptidase
VGSTFRLSFKDDTIPGATGVTAKVKTGTVAVARALIGYLDCGNRRWTFAVLLNRGSSPGIGWAIGLRDKLMVEIAKGMR